MLATINSYFSDFNQKDVVTLILGGIIGVLTSLAFGEWYFRRAARDMRAESVRLRKASDNVITYLENSVDPRVLPIVQRGEDGLITGVGAKIKLGTGSAVAAGARATITGSKGPIEVEVIHGLNPPADQSGRSRSMGDA